MKKRLKYQVISRLCHHHFRIGEIVELIQVHGDGWYEVKNKKGLKQEVIGSDLELLETKKD